MSVLLKQIQQKEHSRCVVCGLENEKGLKLDFDLKSDGSVEACFDGRRSLEGYENMLHGGVISALLDGAMTNCLFAHGISALTAELKVRYLLPVEAKGRIRLRAVIQKSFSRLNLLNGELFQNKILKAKASAKFITPRRVEFSGSDTGEKTSD